jgi:hypothetical protein
MIIEISFSPKIEEKFLKRNREWPTELGPDNRIRNFISHDRIKKPKSKIIPDRSAVHRWPIESEPNNEGDDKVIGSRNAYVH